MAEHDEDKPDAAAEEQAFRNAMRDVRPLPSGPARIAPIARPRRVRRLKHALTQGPDLDQSMPLISADSGADVAAGETLSFRRAGVRDQVLRRLRRGLIPREQELDLHGLSQSVARLLTAQFIEVSRHRGLRCVRIIHGKGMRSGARGAVLKSALNGWLRRHPDVMAFTSARPIDGGTGAAYVLLRA
jgi:DNA-nicking Smr family endonuclease